MAHKMASICTLICRLLQRATGRLEADKPCSSKGCADCPLLCLCRSPRDVDHADRKRSRREVESRDRPSSRHERDRNKDRDRDRDHSEKRLRDDRDRHKSEGQSERDPKRREAGDFTAWDSTPSAAGICAWSDISHWLQLNPILSKATFLNGITVTRLCLLAIIHQ